MKPETEFLKAWANLHGWARSLTQTSHVRKKKAWCFIKISLKCHNGSFSTVLRSLSWSDMLRSARRAKRFFMSSVKQRYVCVFWIAQQKCSVTACKKDKGELKLSVPELRPVPDPFWHANQSNASFFSPHEANNKGQTLSGTELLFTTSQQVNQIPSHIHWM